MKNLLLVLSVFALLACSKTPETKTEVVVITSIKINELTDELKIGGEYQLSITTQPNSTVTATTWGSSNTSVATVSDKGLLKIISYGTADISAYYGTLLDTESIWVRPRVSSVTISPIEIDLGIGDKYQLQYTVSPEITMPDGGELPAKWSSSNPDIATVSEDGLLTMVGRGTATITVSIDGKQGTLIVKTQDITTLEIRNAFHPVSFIDLIFAWQDADKVWHTLKRFENSGIVGGSFYSGDSPGVPMESIKFEFNYVGGSISLFVKGRNYLSDGYGFDENTRRRIDFKKEIMPYTNNILNLSSEAISISDNILSEDDLLDPTKFPSDIEL